MTLLAQVAAYIMVGMLVGSIVGLFAWVFIDIVRYEIRRKKES